MFSAFYDIIAKVIAAQRFPVLALLALARKCHETCGCVTFREICESSALEIVWNACINDPRNWYGKEQFVLKKGGPEVHMLKAAIWVVIGIWFGSVQVAAETRGDEAVRLSKLTISAIQCSILASDTNEAARLGDIGITAGKKFLELIPKLSADDQKVRDQISHYYGTECQDQTVILSWEGYGKSWKEKRFSLMGTSNNCRGRQSLTSLGCTAQNRNENKAESFVGKFGVPDNRGQLFEVPLL